MSFVQGILGNLSEVDPRELEKEYGDYLLDGEKVEMGFKLVRDVVLLTDRRLIEFDKSGMTGKKVKVSFIFLTDIVYVYAETASLVDDDSDIYIQYIRPFQSGVKNLHLEFPRKYDIKKFYGRMLEWVEKNSKRYAQWWQFAGTMQNVPATKS